jgi:(2S)-methylsuccinyl-CoA dehydrogenase
MNLILPDLPGLLDQAADGAQALVADLQATVGERVRRDGRLDRLALDAEQHVAHGLAWAAAYAQTLRQTAAWAHALSASGRFGEAEALPSQLLALNTSASWPGACP